MICSKDHNLVLNNNNNSNNNNSNNNNNNNNNNSNSNNKVDVVCYLSNNRVRNATTNATYPTIP